MISSQVLFSEEKFPNFSCKNFTKTNGRLLLVFNSVEMLFQVFPLTVFINFFSSRLDRHHLRRHEEHSSYEMLRPGFTRISIPFFMSDSELNFVLEALKMVATEGWKLLPQYLLNPETGEWRHHTNVVSRFVLQVQLIIYSLNTQLLLLTVYLTLILFSVLVYVLKKSTSY